MLQALKKTSADHLVAVILVVGMTTYGLCLSLAVNHLIHDAIASFQ